MTQEQQWDDDNIDKFVERRMIYTNEGGCVRSHDARAFMRQMRDDLTAQLAAANQRIKFLEKQANGLQTDKEQWSDQVLHLEDELAAANQRIAELEGEPTETEMTE